MQNPEPRAQYLNIVLRQIDRTSLRIPRFQRHFVWGESNIIELLESIRKGYPIGSVLTWRVESSDNYFSGYREGPFPPADSSLSSFEVVLDGAQRLSTLYGTLRNPDDNPVYRVFFDLRVEQFIHASSVRRIEPWLVPMSALFESRPFLRVQSDLSQLEDAEALLSRVLDLYSTFQDYQVPIITLSNAVLEDVVEVFRRVNSSGTPLSSVDFVRALTWRSSFDLEETFEDLRERYVGSPLEGITEEFLIRCLAITAELSLDSREVIQLRELSNRPEGLQAEVAAMELALDRLAAFLVPLQISRMTEVPYEVQRLILFGIMLYIPDADASGLQNWLWTSTFAEEHQSKPESYVTRLIKDIRAGQVTNALEVRKSIDPGVFADRVRRAGSAITVGFDLILRQSEARSLISGEVLSTSNDLHALLYSRAELEDGDSHIPNARILSNLVALSPKDAVRWKRLRPSHSLEELKAICEDETGQSADIWASQGFVRPLHWAPFRVLNDRSFELLARMLPSQFVSLTGARTERVDDASTQAIQTFGPYFRLVGGPRHGELASSLPPAYAVVGTETFDRPDPARNDIVYEETRFVANWSGDELVS